MWNILVQYIYKDVGLAQACVWNILAQYIYKDVEMSTGVCVEYFSPVYL